MWGLEAKFCRPNREEEAGRTPATKFSCFFGIFRTKITKKSPLFGISKLFIYQYVTQLIFWFPQEFYQPSN